MLLQRPENTASSKVAELVRTGCSKNANDEAHIPRRFRKQSLSNFEGYQLQVDQARSAIARGSGVYIFGPCGCGKTHLANGCLLEWKSQAISNPERKFEVCRFLSSVDLLHELKERFGDSQDTVLLKFYGKIDCLLLDDLGAERITDWSREVFSVLIDHRYRNCKLTLITSNLSLEQVADAFDDRVASRIAGMCEVIELTGPDRRLRLPNLSRKC